MSVYSSVRDFFFARPTFTPPQNKPDTLGMSDVRVTWGWTSNDPSVAAFFVSSLTQTFNISFRDFVHLAKTDPAFLANISDPVVRAAVDAL